MELYLVRHTTPDVPEGVCYGQSDVPLLHSFPSELKQIHDLLNLDDPTTPKVFTSPLSRCVSLAKTLANEYIEDCRLKELNFGDWELQAWDTINNSDLNIWMSNFVHAAPPNGESYFALASRVNEFFNEVITKPYSKVVIVTHAGVLRALLATLLNIDLEKSFKIKIPYGHVIKLEQQANQINVINGLLLEDFQ